MNPFLRGGLVAVILLLPVAGRAGISALALKYRDPAAGASDGAFHVRQGRDGRRTVPLEWDRAAAAATA